VIVTTDEVCWTLTFNSYYSLSDLHAPQIAGTGARMNSSQYLLALVQWPMHYATSRKVEGSRPDEVNIFQFT
jgi:hypothetical protein